MGSASTTQKSYLIAFLVTLGCFLSSCKVRTLNSTGGATPKLVANNSATNIALLYNAPGNLGSYYDADLTNLAAILSDESANFNFKVYQGSKVGLSTIRSNLAWAVPQLSEQSTLFVLLSAHGNQAGQVQLEDGHLFGYEDLLGNLKASASKRFKRLVLIVSACFSGSWIDQVSRFEHKEIFDQLLIITSVPNNQYSYVQSDGSRMVTALKNGFYELKGQSGASLQSLMDAMVRNHQQNFGLGPLYKAYPESILSEPITHINQGNPTQPQQDQPSPPQPNQTQPGGPDTGNSDEQNNQQNNDSSYDYDSSLAWVWMGVTYHCPRNMRLYGYPSGQVYCQ